MPSCRASPSSYQLYRTDDRFSGGAGSASIGSRAGAFAWWIDANHLDSDAQPIGFVVKNLSRRRPARQERR